MYPPKSHICVLLGTGTGTCTSVLKNMTFPNDEFGKGQCAFYPIKLSPFAEKKNKVHQKCQNFIRGDPYKLSQTPLDQIIFQPY